MACCRCCADSRDESWASWSNSPLGSKPTCAIGWAFASPHPGRRRRAARDCTARIARARPTPGHAGRMGDERHRRTRGSRTCPHDVCAGTRRRSVAGPSRALSLGPIRGAGRNRRRARRDVSDSFIRANALANVVDVGDGRRFRTSGDSLSPRARHHARDGSGVVIRGARRWCACAHPAFLERPNVAVDWCDSGPTRDRARVHSWHREPNACWFGRGGRAPVTARAHSILERLA